MKKYGFIAAAALACLTCAAGAQNVNPPVRVALGDITDSRTTGQFFKEFKVEFKLSGDAVFDAYGIGAPQFSEAKDDTGRSLLKDDSKTDSLLWTFQARQKKSDTENIMAQLVNPARKAQVVTLKGTVPVYAPGRDPQSVITIANYSTQLDKPIALGKTADTSITFEQEKGGMSLGMGSGASLKFQVSDPKNRIVHLEVVAADGKPLESGGRSKFSNNGVDSYSYSFRQPFPAGAVVKVYIATPQSMMNVPFAFENIPLP